MDQIISSSDLFGILQEFNPWWSGRTIPDLPKWRRATFRQLRDWVIDPPSRRAVLLSGARQVGKTTLLLQLVGELQLKGVPHHRIIYATLDHPLLKLAGIEGVLRVWEEFRRQGEGPEFILLDEVQHDPSWATWLKHQVDFRHSRQIVVTGSVVPLSDANAESGVGRWHTIKLPTLSFCEYLQIREIEQPDLPELFSLTKLFGWSEGERMQAASLAKPLVGHFHEYLLRSGFPQAALVDSISLAQRLLRADIVDKILKRDMTAYFGVRHIAELEKLFVYICLHDGGMFDIRSVASNLGISKQTVERYIRLCEASHLVYLLRPFGYGKEVLRGRPKLYLADAAIAGSVLLKGRSLLEDDTALGLTVETAFFKHVFAHYYGVSMGLSYWRRPKAEVDIIAEVSDQVVPFEVKYRNRIRSEDIAGLRVFCEERGVSRGYLISRELRDFRVMGGEGGSPMILIIPACLACYWLSRLELQHSTLEG